MPVTLTFKSTQVTKNREGNYVIRRKDSETPYVIPARNYNGRVMLEVLGTHEILEVFYEEDIEKAERSYQGKLIEFNLKTGQFIRNEDLYKVYINGLPNLPTFSFPGNYVLAEDYTHAGSRVLEYMRNHMSQGEYPMSPEEINNLKVTSVELVTDQLIR